MLGDLLVLYGLITVPVGLGLDAGNRLLSGGAEGICVFL